MKYDREQIKSALLDKNDDNWSRIVSEQDPTPIIYDLIKENMRNNRVPISTIESSISCLVEGIRIEDMRLLVRLRVI